MHQSRVEKLSVILSGEATIQQHLQFLISNNHSDLLILRHTKDAVRASVCHTATVIANGFMHCGTTSDQVNCHFPHCSADSHEIIFNDTETSL